MTDSIKNTRSSIRFVLCLLMLLVVAPCAQARIIKILTVAGDWKAQAWYQDVWMQGKGQKLLRGRWIAQKANQAAPGRFEFTDITNYTAQEYLDADYLSQFDVVLLGDTYGMSFSPRFQQAVEGYVKNGGGLIYCGSYKWQVGMVKNTPFEAVLPAAFPLSCLTDDIVAGKKDTDDRDFKPVPARLEHPVMKGLDWASAPTLPKNFIVLPKQGADVLLKAPSNTPVLVAWKYGKGRTMLSTVIFANDDISERFCSEWKDIGKFYAQTFTWLGGNSKNAKAMLKPTVADVAISVDHRKPLNTVPSAMFSVHGAQSCPGFDPLQGQALEYFKALNPKGHFARFDVDCESERGKFDFASVDSELVKIKALEMEPIALFSAYGYGKLKWLWPDGANWVNPSDQVVADIVEGISRFLEHTNGRKDAPNYRANVKYIEVFNEPVLNSSNIDGYVKIFHAVAQHVHQHFPEVKVGGVGGTELPYVYWFIDKAGADIDWISRHPYGWTGEMLFKLQDDFRGYVRKKGYTHIKFIITEWDFWIQGRQKFDYMMKRYFEAVKREDTLGTLHFRLGMYNEPVYLFGILWAEWGQDRGAGTRNTPMHDAYDALWIFRSFRGQRVQVAKALTTAGSDRRLLDHVFADASRDGERLNVVLYYDWAYGGTGYKDYANGLSYSKVNVKIKFTLSPMARERTLTVSQATGEGFQVIRKDIKIPANRTEHAESVTLDPITALSITIQ